MIESKLYHVKYKKEQNFRLGDVKFIRGIQLAGI